MNGQERGELLDLWKLVPACIPKAIIVGPYGDIMTAWCKHVPDTVLAALARDAIVEWLMAQQSPDDVDQVRFAVEDDTNPAMKHAVDRGGCNWYHGPTRLLALIAAARAVAGKGGGK